MTCRRTADRPVARRPWPILILGAAMLVGCSDPFGVQDAVGVWALQEFNGVTISGRSPMGVWIRESGGSDSTLVVIESVTLEFAAASACVWTIDDGFQGAVADTDCLYAITPGGELTVEVGAFSLRGMPDRSAMLLRDTHTNELTFVKGL